MRTWWISDQIGTSLLCCFRLLAFAAVLSFPAIPASAQQTDAGRSAAVVASSAAEDLAALIEEVVALGRENPPPLPSPEGTDPRYSDRLPIVSEEYIREHAFRAERLLERVLALDTAQLTREQPLDVYVLTDRLRSRIADARFRTYLLGDTRLTDEAATSGPAPLRVLLITGGGWHDYDAQQRILADGITARVNAEITIDHEGGQNSGARISRHRSTEWAREFDVVVYNMCFSEVRDLAWTESIVRAHVAQQVPAVVLHCTMHSYNYQGDSPIWSMFVGVRTNRHQRQMPFTVETLDGEHPIMIDFPATWRTPQGELYEITEVYPTATPLAHALGEDSGEHQVTIWTNRFAGVRVFGTTIGHHNETMATETYLELIADGLLWAADKLDSTGRPVAGYEAVK